MVQNRFGVKSYGLYYTLITISFFFSFVLDFGISKYQSVSVAQAKHLSKRNLFSLLRLKNLLSLIYLIASLLTGFYFDLTSEQFLSLFALCLCQVFLSYILFARSAFSGLGVFFWEGLFSVLDRTIMILICIGWLTLPWFFPTINDFIWIQFLGYGISFAYAGWVLWGILKRHRNEEIGKSSLLKETIYLAMPFAFLAGLEIINDRIGTLLLNHMQSDGTEQVGWYAYGQRWLDAFKMFASLIAVILVTYYTRLRALEQRLLSLIKLCVLAILIPVSVMAIVASFNAPMLTILLYKKSSDYLSLIFILNILSFVPYCLIYIFQPLLMANGHIKRLNVIFGIGLLINLLLSMLLIPAYKAVGISLAFLASSFVIMLLQIVFSPPPAKFKLLLPAVMKIGIILVLVAGVAYYIHKLMPIYFQFLLCLCLSIVFTFLFRLIKFSSIAIAKELYETK